MKAATASNLSEYTIKERIFQDNFSYKYARLVGILENKNVKYKSVYMPGKIINGFNSMLNNI